MLTYIYLIIKLNFQSDTNIELTAYTREWMLPGSGDDHRLSPPKASRHTAYRGNYDIVEMSMCLCQGNGLESAFHVTFSHKEVISR